MDKQKILIVDDSEINRALLADILKDQYEVVEADNGAAAVALLSQHRMDFSLLLLDIMMPEMDGFEVLSYINRYHWNDTLAVIMISADDSPANIRRAYDLGAFDYISRPFDSAIVHRRISNTMLLYARQRHLENIITEQFSEQERNNKLMISISDTILNKPGRLTGDEFEVIKTHAAIGAEMLSELPIEQQELPLVKVASEICRWHHERYDGTGSPDKLVGDEIPISAQVVSLADVYDALISERCYKKAYTYIEALTMILEGQCGTFNPILIQCLLETADAVKAELRDISLEQEDKYIRSMRNKIDYDRLLTRKRSALCTANRPTGRNSINEQKTT